MVDFSVRQSLETELSKAQNRLACFVETRRKLRAAKRAFLNL
jgi:hypothetical protein